MPHLYKLTNELGVSTVVQCLFSHRSVVLCSLVTDVRISLSDKSCVFHRFHNHPFLLFVVAE